MILSFFHSNLLAAGISLCVTSFLPIMSVVLRAQEKFGLKNILAIFGKMVTFSFLSLSWKKVKVSVEQILPKSAGCSYFDFLSRFIVEMLFEKLIIE